LTPRGRLRGDPGRPEDAQLTYLEYAARGKTEWWRYLVATPLALALSFALGLAITLPLTLANLLPKDFAAQIAHPESPEKFFALNGALFAVVLAGFYGAIALLHKKRFGDIVGAWRWRSFGIGFCAWGGGLVLLMLLDFAISPSGFSVSATERTAGLAAFALAALGLQTFAEEFVFRGYLTQGLLLALRRPAIAALVSGLIFGSIHIPNGWPQAANAVVFGAVTALIAIRTGGVAFTFGMHLINNLFGAVVVVSSGDVFKGAPGLFTQDTPHLQWWDAFATCAALVVLGVVVLRRMGPAPAAQSAAA